MRKAEGGWSQREENPKKKIKRRENDDQGEKCTIKERGWSEEEVNPEQKKIIKRKGQPMEK